jgi:hypothetical protein
MVLMKSLDLGRSGRPLGGAAPKIVKIARAQAVDCEQLRRSSTLERAKPAMFVIRASGEMRAVGGSPWLDIKASKRIVNI